MFGNPTWSTAWAPLAKSSRTHAESFAFFIGSPSGPLRSTNVRRLLLTRTTSPRYQRATSIMWAPSSLTAPLARRASAAQW